MKKDWMIRESELDDDQIKVLQATLNKACIVSGCAGSGKSVLALIKAKRIQENFGNNYQVIVFTKALTRYMNSGRGELGLEKKFLYYREWKDQGAPSFDYIVVDEIQDFNKEEIQELIQKANKQFFFFGDTAQSIYDGLKDKGRTVPVNEIRYLVEEPERRKNTKEFTLFRNYRLPLPVAKFANCVGEDLEEFIESTYKSPERSIPRVLKCPEKEDQLKRIHAIIQTNHFTDVAILLPTNDVVKDVYDYLRNLGGNYECKYYHRESISKSEDSLDFMTSNPKIMTYHSAKGLQFETVFLPYIEDVKNMRRKALYVAITRTYRNLYLMYTNELPTILKSIDGNLYKTTEKDEIKDI